MLKSCLPYLGSPDCIDGDPSKSKELEGPNPNDSLTFVDSTFQSKHIFVRVVHAGGKVDHYPNAVLAAKLLENLPRKCLARPEVFKHPHESLISPEEYLLPGHKYYVIPLSTIRKLKRKHSKMVGIERRSEEISSDVSAVEASDVSELEESCMHESYGFARDFYASKLAEKEKWSTCVIQNGNGSRSGGGGGEGGGGGVSKRTRILLPHPKPKTCSGYTWEPGLTSIQEVSP